MVNGICVRIQENNRVRKSVAFLLNDVWYNMVVDVGCAKVYVALVYGPSEGEGLESLAQGFFVYILNVMGDL